MTIEKSSAPDLSLLARPEILSLKAYESARSLVSSEKSTLTYLDANEYPEGPFCRYPEPQPRALLQRMSELYGVSEKNMVVGRGSDEAIDLLVRTFCRAGQDQILICPPTYGMYEVAARTQGAEVVRVPLLLGQRLNENKKSSSDQQHLNPALNLKSILSAVDRSEGRMKLVFICSPNNPTGTAFPVDEIKELASKMSNRALLVVDEAYGEFHPSGSMLPSLNEFSNLVVLRTLSKAWALAALRCGTVMASDSVISLLHKVRAPYPIPLPTCEKVLELTAPLSRESLQARLEFIKTERARMISALSSIPCVLEVFESHANFLLMRLENSASVMKASRQSGMILRDRSQEHRLENCIRVTLGTTEQNNQLLKVLSAVSVSTHVSSQISPQKDFL